MNKYIKIILGVTILALVTLFFVEYYKYFNSKKHIHTQSDEITYYFKYKAKKDALLNCNDILYLSADQDIIAYCKDKQKIFKHDFGKL